MPTASPTYAQVRRPAQNLTDSQIKVTPARAHFEWRGTIGEGDVERVDGAAGFSPPSGSGQVGKSYGASVIDHLSWVDMSGNACPQCGREHPWCEVEWSADVPDASDPEGPPYRVADLLPDVLDLLARGSRGPEWAAAREGPGRRSLRGLIPGPRRRF